MEQSHPSPSRESTTGPKMAGNERKSKNFGSPTVK